MYNIFVKVHSSDRRKNANHGFSLIEVIVSMLIMGIVVVPLLTNFSVTARTNAKAKVMKDATDYAQTIMESLQTYGAESVNNQFWNGQAYQVKNTQTGNYDDKVYGDKDGHEAEAFKIASGESVTRAAVTSDFSTKATKLYEAGDKKYYTILGAKASNGRSYDVSIEYDPTTYSNGTTTSSATELLNAKAYNINQFPDLTTFSKTSTAVIDPSGNTLTYETKDDKYVYDEDKSSYKASIAYEIEGMAVNTFYNRYIGFLTEVCENVNTLLTSYNISDESLVSTEDIMDKTETVKKGDIQKSTTRNTVIKVSKTTDGAINLTSNLVFKVSSDQLGNKEAVKQKLSEKFTGKLHTNAFADSEYPYDGALKTGVENIVDTAYTKVTASANQKWEWAVKNSDFSNLENIYLMYNPLKASEWGNTAVDTIYVDVANGIGYDAQNMLQLYIVPQLGLSALKDGTDTIQATNYVAPKIAGGNVNIKWNGDESDTTYEANDTNLERIMVNYMTDYLNTSSENSAIVKKTESITSKYDSEDVLYNITIKIFSHSSGSEIDESKYLTEFKLAGV